MSKINMIHGDCMDLMKSKPDNFYDLAIVDPEYGRHEHGGVDRSGFVLQKNGTKLFVKKGNHYKKKDWDKEPVNEKYFDELLRVSKNQIIWGCNYYARNIGKGRIVWDKVNEGSDQSDCEIAYNSTNERVDLFRYMWRGMMQGKSISEGEIMQGNKKLNEKRIHPTQKPVLLYRFLLNQYAETGDKILDTHGGSGSSVIACYEEGFYMDVEEEGHVDGLMRYSEIRSVVSRYVNALKCFDEFKEISDRMNNLVSPIGLTDGFEFKFGYNKAVTTKEDFAKELQKQSWKWIFGKMNMDKFVTSGVMSDINKFVEIQEKYPFTMKNIYRMLEIIIGTRGQIMDRALEEAFDKITQHYHENRYQVEGWKTNSHYLINEKFILPNVCEVGFRGELKFKFSSWGNEERINDLHKALCYIAGTRPVDPERLDKDNKPEKITGLRSWATGKDLDFATWYDWGFFKIKGFKKGTLHCKFKDKKVWEQFNRRVAEIKGYPLPENVGLV